MNTKVYGTVGPACSSVKVLSELFEEGMTGIRINLSHVNLPEVGEWIENIKTAHRKSGKKELEILIDLQGPELRLGKLLAERELAEENHLTLMAEGKTNLFDPTEVPVPRPVFDALEVGMHILIDDGKILLEVEERRGRAAECIVKRGGILRGGKSIAVPDVRFATPTLTESDMENLRQAKSYGITGVMLPFVREKEDLQNLKQALEEVGAGELRVFAKIENRDGVAKLEEMLPYCQEVIVARGDLGNAMPPWELPVVQAKIAKVCREAGKPFMIVTQMLSSMEKTAVPTRAETSDIYRAVSEGAASVMLTGETAIGKYPVEAVRCMVKTVECAEEYIKL